MLDKKAITQDVYKTEKGIDDERVIKGKTFKIE